MHNVIWFVFLGSRGGETRARVLELVRKRPLNAHQLKKELDLDYSTVRHSLRVLEKNHILVTSGDGYGATYTITPEFESILGDYDTLMECHRKEKHCSRPKWEKLLKQHLGK